ncbi:MAG: ribonuclease R [Deltaproteobacteria bacterium]|nr:MAG: ribonuclease R [Deltaproteobacteria bacterium]
MTSRIDKDAVLSVLRDRAPRGVHHGEVLGALDAPKKDRDYVLDLLEDLVEHGLAKQMPGRRFRAVKQTPIRVAPTRGRRSGGETVDGRLTMHRNGFAFVAADDGGPDIFIPPPSVGAAFHGDRVRVSARPSPKGREGTVTEVLEHSLRLVGGVLRRSGGNTWVDPDDARLRGPLVVVGPIPEDAKSGLQVVAEIVHYPRYPDEVPEVEVIETLGAAGVTAVEVRKLKIRDGVVEEFPQDVRREAETFAKSVTKAEKAKREDLRDYELVTIDPSDARDHDDALWAERIKGGGFRVLIAIADVAHYVRPETAIDREAFERGCSIYLPDRAIPMLPPELSSHLASLVPNKDRLTMAVLVELSATGAVKKHRFIEGVMRSRARITYDGAARALGLTDQPKREKEAEDRIEMLRVLFDAAKVLRARRSKRGSLNFDLPEPRLKLDEETQEPIDVYRQKGDPGIRQAYNLVEEMMLLANETVAEDLERRGMPAVYRVHGIPDEKKLLKVTEVAHALGEVLSPDDAVVPKELAKFVRRIEGKPNARTIHYLLLRAMQQAAYDTKCIGHFALAAKYYCHFTSPIRRYPDLCVHRAMKVVIRDEEYYGDDLRRDFKRASIEASRLERRATKLERDVLDLYRCVLMQDRIGEEFDATITGMSGHGFYSSFDEPFVDALTPLERLADYFEVDDLGIRMIGERTGTRFELGDKIRLRLENVSLERREITAVPIGDITRDPDQVASRKALPGRRGQGRDRGAADDRGPRGDRGRGRKSERDEGAPKGAPKGPAARRGDDAGRKKRRDARDEKREKKKERRGRGKPKGSVSGGGSKGGKGGKTRRKR